MFAATAAFLWGFLAIFLKVTLDFVPPLTIVWMRFVVAFLALALILYVKNPQAMMVLRKPPVLGIVAALGLTFNYCGYIMGLDLTSPSNTQVVIQLAPLLLALVGLIIYKEKLSRVQALGFIVAILGFGLFYRDQIKNLLGSTNEYQRGITWVVAAALAWVLFAALQKNLVKSHHAQGLNLIIYLVPALILWPLADFEVISNLTWPLWLLIVFLGLNTLLAYGAIAESFKYLPANKVGIIVTLNPIITIVTMTVLAAWEVSWIEPERISSMGIVGASLILAGVILAIIAKRRQQTKIEKLAPAEVVLEIKE